MDDAFTITDVFGGSGPTTGPQPSRQPGPANPPARFLIGVDLGRVTTSIAVGTLQEDGELRVVDERAERHEGDPLGPFLRLYAELGREAVLGVVATGTHAERLAPPVVSGLPEEVAQEQAAALLWPGHGPLNVARLGGSGFSALALSGDGDAAFEKNDRCSAGAGESVERLCARLGQTLDEAMAMAEDTDEVTAVTARCAVFAKSELTHYANQGEPHGKLFRGQFQSVAVNLHGLFDKIKVAGPTFVVGHGALIRPIVDEFARLAGGDVSVPAEAPVFEALGALAYAAGHEWPAAAVWPADPAELARPPHGRISSLPAAGEGPGQVVQLQEPGPAVAAPAADATSAPTAVLGLDLGSTGSKAALVELGSGRVLADVYRRTDGNPVEAAAALVAELREMSDAVVVAIGVTGSGRDAAATVARAAYPEIGGRLCVQNEIVAHATAASRYDPAGGSSLSIIEIGGQDAKFINVRNGRVVDSDMNRVCSAGTGSFLEEQAEAFGVHDIAEFGELAARSTRPPDLGQTCTVFVGDVAVEALSQGYSREDVFAGLQFSVVRNYRSRVMGQRRFQERIMFQGKPASSASLARTLAAVTGRTVCVPPNPGAMGAIGIALLAAQGVGFGTPEETVGAPLDLERLLRARVRGRREFRCRDRSCGNMCRIESATVDLDGEARTVVSGGTCPKYDVAGAVGKLPKGAPRPFHEREELLARLLGEVPSSERPGADGRQRPGRPEDTDGRRVDPMSGGPVVGIPYCHYLIDALPFFHAFFTALGARVQVIRSTRASLADGDRRCAAAGSCAPVKIAHALTGAQADALFLPKLINVPYPGAHWGPSTCPMTQGTPEMVEAALRAEGDQTPVLRPLLFRDVAKGYQSRELAAELAGLGAALAKLSGGAWTPNAFPSAFKAAVQAQRAFEDGLAAIGERALRAARQAGVPVVLVVGETHVLHEPLLNPGIHDLVAANGAIAIPVDCFPVSSDVPPMARVHWASAGRMLRAGVAAARRGDVFPMLMGAYGCGPNSFVEHLFNDLFEEYPHTVLETDGHGGTAGYVTRVQAFLHAVHAYQAERAARGEADGDPVPPARLARYDEPMPHSFEVRGRSGPIYFGNAGGSLGRQVAAAMRGRGMDAVAIGPSNEDSLLRAGDGCSGKECLPYQLLWGSLARFIEQDGDGGLNGHGNGDGEAALLLSVGNGFRSCRAAVFPLTEMIGLERLGVADRITIGDLSMLTDDMTLTPIVWAAIVANDLLLSMRFYHQADEAVRGDSDALYERYAAELERELERRDDGVWAEAGAIRRAGSTAASVFRAIGRVQRVVAEAAAAYAVLPALAGAESTLRDVFLCGDIYLRIDEWGNDDLHRRLSDLGLRPIIEPYAGFFELIALRDTQEMPLTDSRAVKRRLTLRFMRVVVSRLLGSAREHQPWLFWNDINAVEAASREAFDGYPFGESITSIGGALHTWQTRPVDGVVLVLPRGCGPALISEAQLRRASGAPTLFVYSDGDPIDVARLAGFAWRLRSRPARRATASTAACPAPGAAAR